MTEEQRKLMQETKFKIRTPLETKSVSAEEIDKALNSNKLFEVLTSSNIDENEKQHIIAEQIEKYVLHELQKYNNVTIVKSPKDYVNVTFKFLFIKKTYNMMFKDARLFMSILRVIKLSLLFMFIVFITQSQQLPAVKVCSEIFQFGFTYYIIRLFFRMMSYLIEGE